jgi:putative spermidine/putrescine transport system ATP-binding protein
VPSMSGAAVTLQHLVKRYGDTTAVDDVSLEVRPGEFITFLGPSGSGKTTTLNAIAGFVHPTAGEITMDGHSLGNIRPHRREIGMIFQNYALFPHMTAAANIAYPLKQRKVAKSEIEARVASALALVGLEQLGARYPRQLSGGQQQRVAFARSVVFRPRVLLMDEPLGALDRKLREALQVEIKRIHRELGITFVYVTHDQDEALALSDRIAVFNEGKIEQVGTAAELYERPQTLFVAEFVGDSNVFRGPLADDARSLEFAGTRILLPPLATDTAGDAAVMVRPRHMILSSQDDAAGPQNALAGQVAETVYLGQSVNVVVELDVGQRAQLREPPERGLSLSIGQRVVIGWAPADAVVFVEGARVPPLEGAAESESTAAYA